MTSDPSTARASAANRHLDMPCTPERVWRAIRDAEAGSPPPAWRPPPPVFERFDAEAAATAATADDATTAADDDDEGSDAADAL